MPAHRGDSKPLGRPLFAWLAYHEGAILGKASSEFCKPFQLPWRHAPDGDFNRPAAPGAIEYAIHLQRLLAPIGDALLGIPRVAQAGVLDPCAEARRIPVSLGYTVGVRGS